ncbi:MAG TPA: MarR family transcriptional regulator [Acidimicrobiales bacterium]|nr:MarR family transcriptional regulator [Acidimicrobiales bacterium]
MSRHLRRHAELVGQLTLALRDVSGQLARLNQTVGSHIGLALTDLGILELVARRGPLTPSRLASLSGLRPATMTGILDRLETEGWVRRERDPDDRRKVNIFAVEHRREMRRWYGGMQRRVQQICADYDDEQLALIIEFLARTAEAGVASTKDLLAR